MRSDPPKLRGDFQEAPGVIAACRMMTRREHLDDFSGISLAIAEREQGRRCGIEGHIARRAAKNVFSCFLLDASPNLQPAQRPGSCAH